MLSKGRLVRYCRIKRRITFKWNNSALYTANVAGANRVIDWFLEKLSELVTPWDDGSKHPAYIKIARHQSNEITGALTESHSTKYTPLSRTRHQYALWRELQVTEVSVWSGPHVLACHRGQSKSFHYPRPERTCFMFWKGGEKKSSPPLNNVGVGEEILISSWAS